MTDEELAALDNPPMTSPSAAAVQEAMTSAELEKLARDESLPLLTRLSAYAKDWQVRCGYAGLVHEAIAHVTALTAEKNEIAEQLSSWIATAATTAEDLTSRLAAAENERDALREKYEGVKAGDWFYPDGDTSSEACCDNVDEVLTERYEAQHDGSAIYVIERAVKLPDLHVSVRVFSEEEKAARGSDDDYVASLHLTAEEARTALGAAP